MLESFYSEDMKFLRPLPVLNEVKGQEPHRDAHQSLQGFFTTEAYKVSLVKPVSKNYFFILLDVSFIPDADCKRVAQWGEINPW